MDILSLSRKIAQQVNLGVPFTIYMGGGGKRLDSKKPYVCITLAEIPNNFLPADGSSYSWIDFAYDPDNKIIHSPWINLIPKHRGGKIARKLNNIMEEVGRQMGFTHVRVHDTIVNEKLKRLMPHFGYTNSGTDSLGKYVEKQL